MNALNGTSREAVLIPMTQISARLASQEHPVRSADTFKILDDWLKSYLMMAHPDLGRVGAVCPFTAQALRLDTIRVGVSEASSPDAGAVLETMRDCFRQFKLIPCKPSMRHFRTIVMGFPHLDTPAGLDSLRAAQKKLRFYSLVRGMMVGLFHGGTDAPGLWNADFRPLRSPVPLLAIRHLVANDAAFAARHPLLVPAYVAKFPLVGPRKLLAHIARRTGSSAG